MKQILKITVSLLAGLLLLVVTACTDYETPASVAGDIKDVSSGHDIKKYVLWINIEGAGGGDLVKQALPADGTIMSMLAHSKYMWNGLESEHADGEQYVEPEAENPVANASMLTGALPMRHGIDDASYIAEPAIFDPSFDESLKVYPSFLQYVTDYNKALKSLVVTPWKKMNENLLYQADRIVTTTTDEETVQKVIESWEDQMMDYRVTYLSFRDVLDAAKSGGGWHSGNTEYAAAFKKVDSHVGHLLDVINGRKNAYLEDWLVIVTSNCGGKADGSYGGMSLEERNMFGIFYYSHFSESKEMVGNYNSLLRFDKSFQAVVIDSTEVKTTGKQRQLYSMPIVAGADNGMTVEYIMAARPSKNRSYIPGGQSGVGIMNKGRWSISMGHTYNSSSAKVLNVGDNDRPNAGDFVTPSMHSYTATYSFKDVVDEVRTETSEEDEFGVTVTEEIAYKKGKVDVIAYYDGIVTSPRSENIDRQALLCEDNANLTINGGLNWSCRYFAEIRIWKRALVAEEVARYAGQLKLTPENCPIYSDLIGYWQFYEGGQYLEDDSLVINQIPEVNGLPTEPLRLRTLDAATGKYVSPVPKQIRYMNVPYTAYPAHENGQLLMESTTVIPEIFYWLGVPYPEETTRGDGFKGSKLDGVWHPLDMTSKTQIWKGYFLNKYEHDLEWRDYEK